MVHTNFSKENELFIFLESERREDWNELAQDTWGKSFREILLHVMN